MNDCNVCFTDVAMDCRVIPEMYYFKNKDAKHIIIYDDDERIASRAAKEMVEKG